MNVNFDVTINKTHINNFFKIISYKSTKYLYLPKMKSDNVNSRFKILSRDKKNDHSGN